MNPSGKSRIDSIDILRGIVMIIMALDHVRDYFHIAANTDNPLNLETTTPLLFFTRWVTHFCAPVFIFLSGTSIYLQSLRKTKSELSIFLVKRGLWLIFVEVAIVSLGWSFNPSYNTVFLQVIWAIGISMVLLAFIIRLPFNLILAIGLVIVSAHNLLDYYESMPGFQASFFWDIIHHGKFAIYSITENHTLLIVYPFFAWTGLMMLGYCLGKLFSPGVSVSERRKKLIFLGTGMILLFVLLRTSNLYGDPVPWSTQKNRLFTFFSFIDVNKYPPSLLFMCVTIGPALLALAWLEKIKNGFTNGIKIYGRVALFYYVIHIYLVHTLSMIAFFSRGHHLSEAYKPTLHFPFYFLLPGEGYRLPVIYSVWILVVIALYPLCKWYNDYKTTHKDKWWVSYV